MNEFSEKKHYLIILCRCLYAQLEFGNNLHARNSGNFVRMSLQEAEEICDYLMIKFKAEMLFCTLVSEICTK
jgi:hypothetical protein